MESVPQEHSAPQSPQLSKDGGFLKESTEDKDAREKARVERANEKKEEILWKSLRTAEAAMQIEQYFRGAPKNPSVHDIIQNVEVPDGSVDRNFLRIVIVIAERFNRQRQDVDAVMVALTERAAAGRGRTTNQEIAELVFNQINPRIPKSSGALKISKRDGYFVLTVANHADYHALYGEDTEKKKSGGRFHRALRITVAGRDVPVIVHHGGTIYNEETNEVMIHEKQHWINESLVKLGFVESERPSLFTVPADERNTALLKERHHRAIKDEVLAHLRQGHVKDIKQTLFSDLYVHLFNVQPNDKREQEDRALVTKISDELDRCSHMLTASMSVENSRLRSVMVYVLMGVKLRRFPEYLVAMRGLLERVRTLDQTSQENPEADMFDIEMLPRAYQEDHEKLLDASFAIDKLAEKGWQARVGFDSRDNTRSFLALREEIKDATVQKAKKFEAIMRGNVFPPYLMRTGGGEFENERHHEQELRADILDGLSAVANSTVQKVCGRRGAAEELLVIAQGIKGTLAKYGRIDPSVTFSVAERGVQVHVGYQIDTPQDDTMYMRTMSHTYVLTRCRYWDFAKTPRARERDFDNAEMLLPDQMKKPGETAPAVRQTREIANGLEDALADYLSARQHFDRAISRNDAHYIVVGYAQDVQRCENRIELALQAFIRNGAHIPDVKWFEGVDLGDEQVIIPSVARAAEGLRNVLFDAASAYPQGKIDSAMIDLETDTDPDATDRVEKQFDALIVKQLGGRQFGSGKIKNIRCGGVYLGMEDRTLGARVMFEVQRCTGGFIPVSVDVIFHRTSS